MIEPLMSVTFLLTPKSVILTILITEYLLIFHFQI